FFRGALRNAVEMAAHRPDEGDPHHADFKFRRRRMALGDCEGVDDMELDLLLADGLARLLRQLFPDLGRRELWLNTLWSGETTSSTSSSSALVSSTGSGLRVM